MRVGLVKEAAAVKGSDKLLHLQVDIGEPKLRSIVAGIAGAYQPEALIGRKVVIVANLAAAQAEGIGVARHDRCGVAWKAAIPRWSASLKTCPSGRA